MKQLITLAIATTLGIGNAFAVDNSGKHTTLKSDFVTVTYGQPAGAAASFIPSFGTPWGTGTGEITSVSLRKGCMFAGKQVNPGTYSLVTVPYKGEWLVFLVDPNHAAEDMKSVEVLRDHAILSSNAIIKDNDKNVDGMNMEVSDKAITISWEKKKIVISIEG